MRIGLDFRLSSGLLSPMASPVRPSSEPFADAARSLRTTGRSEELRYATWNTRCVKPHDRFQQARWIGNVIEKAACKNGSLEGISLHAQNSRRGGNGGFQGTAIEFGHAAIPSKRPRHHRPRPTYYTPKFCARQPAASIKVCLSPAV